MSTFRKTVLTTAIIGAGLASTTGSAFASDCHDSDHHSSHGHSKSASKHDTCSNEFGAGIDNGGVTNTMSALTGNAGAIQSNICDVLNNNLNGNLSGNNIALGAV